MSHNVAPLTAIITVQGVEKSFGSRHVLAGVSLAVHEHDRIGLLGVNGSGKSTLLSLIALGVAAGADEGTQKAKDATGPDEGLITRRRDLSMEYVPQEPRLPPERTVIEVVREGLRGQGDALTRLAALERELAVPGGLSGPRLDAALLAQSSLHERLTHLGGWDQEHEIRGIAASLHLPPFTARVGDVSIGERRRVALARALLSRPDVLCLDEPTNHLDARTVEWLEARLLALPGALLLITHDRYFLDRVATRILELDRGQIYAYEGSYTRFLEKQAERLDNEANRERERASFVRRELDWIRRGPQARATKQQARIDRFDQAVAAGPKGGLRQPGSDALKLSLPGGGRLGKTILEFKGLGKSLGGKRLFSGLDLIVKGGDRIGIVGENGAGKTTLLRTLLGHIQPDEGQVVVGLNTRFSFLDQGRADLHDERTVLEEVADGNEQVFLGDRPVHVRTFLRMMLFSDGFADTPVGSLSGGERNRVQLAKLLRVGGNVLVLDEPTHDLDLITLGVLEEALQDFPGCALIVSHDRWFLDRVATGILAFQGAGNVVFHEGNYSTYLARRQQEETDLERQQKERVAAQPDAKSDTDARQSKNAPSAARRRTYHEQKELAGMEAVIGAAEAKVTELQGVLADPSIYKDRGADVPALVAALDAARVTVERLYLRWQELESFSR